MSLGVIDVGTVAGGAFSGALMSNAVVNLGFSHYGTDGDRMWTDNFQVGEPVPEPGLIALALSGFLAMMAVRRGGK